MFINNCRTLRVHDFSKKTYTFPKLTLVIKSI